MLPSPIINGVLPAFYFDENGRGLISIPFTMSKAVNKAQIKKYKLKIRNIQGLDYLAPVDSFEVDYTNGVVYFEILSQEKEKFLIGNFYKVQLAYVDINNTTGYYSSIGIIKCTTKPEVYIDNLIESGTNAHQYTYVGTYSQSGAGKDYTEKVYSYRFVIKDTEDNIVEDTGFKIHNNSNDVEYNSSSDSFTISKELDISKRYNIQYTIITNNGLEISSPSYRVTSKNTVISNLESSFGRIIPKINFDNGYISIGIQWEKPESEPRVRGSFILAKTSSATNYQEWEEVARFNLKFEKASKKSWKDFNVQQGVYYKYSIQQYNTEGLYSDRLISEPCYMDFEDIFLYDGERQLKIRFDPQVSSFKNTVLESKQETLGSKHPFIFRNSSVEYKEFPLKGLITYESDEEKLFSSDVNPLELPLYRKASKGYSADNQQAIAEYESIYGKDLEAEEFFAERRFKLKVLEWLTNGEPKLFKSPSEGNYLIRLLNVSYSPQEKLARKIHNFQATAYEVAELTYDNLKKYNIVRLVDNAKELEMTALTIPLRTKDAELVELINLKSPNFYKYDRNSKYYIAENVSVSSLVPAQSNIEFAQFQDMTPGTIFVLNKTAYNEGETIVIGNTGEYFLETPVQDIYITPSSGNGVLTIFYQDFFNSSFNLVKNIELEDVIGEQVIGKSTNLFYSVENVARKIVSIYGLRATKRPVVRCWIDEDNKVYLKDTIQQIGIFDSDNKQITFVEGYLVNELALYSFEYEYINFKGEVYSDNTNRNIKAYRPIYFLNEVTNEQKEMGYLPMRDANLFTLSEENPIFREVDGAFVRILNFSEIQINHRYWVYHKPTYYFDPKSSDTICIDRASYSYLLEYKDKDLVESSFIPYEATLKIDNFSKGDINLEELYSITLEDYKVTQLERLDSTIGIYCELFYSVQHINYNIETEAHLQILKNTLDESKYKTTEEYYKNEIKGYPAREEEYLGTGVNSLMQYKKDYLQAYSNYLEALTEFVEKKDQG